MSVILPLCSVCHVSFDPISPLLFLFTLSEYFSNVTFQYLNFFHSIFELLLIVVALEFTTYILTDLNWLRIYAQKETLTAQPHLSGT